VLSFFYTLTFLPYPGSINTSLSSNAVLPRNTTFRTRPFTFQPSNGVQPQRECKSDVRIS